MVALRPGVEGDGHAVDLVVAGEDRKAERRVEGDRALVDGGRHGAHDGAPLRAGEAEEALVEVAAQPGGVTLRFDDIATRSAGQRRFADLHMHVPGDWALRRAAALRDELEQALMDALPGLRVTIQLLPLDMEARASLLAEEQGVA